MSQKPLILKVAGLYEISELGMFQILLQIGGIHGLLSSWKAFVMRSYIRIFLPDSSRRYI